MKAYKNVMETIVENRLSEIINNLDCCHCEHCQNDIIAYALNRLPPKYVVTQAGEAYSKTYTLGMQHEADILAALSLGAKVVKQQPRH